MDRLQLIVNVLWTVLFCREEFGPKYQQGANGLLSLLPTPHPVHVTVTHSHRLWGLKVMNVESIMMTSVTPFKIKANVGMQD